MDLQKSKLIIIVPIVVSILAATFGSVKYIINLTDTIEKNSTQVILLNKDINQIFDKYAQDKEEFTREMFNVNGRVTEVNAYFRALEEILRKTTDSVRDQQWDIKDLQREVLGDQNDKVCYSLSRSVHRNSHRVQCVSLFFYG